MTRRLWKQETRWASLAGGFFVGCKCQSQASQLPHLTPLSDRTSIPCGSWLACDGVGASASELSDKPFRLSVGTRTTNLLESLPIQQPGLQA